MKARSNQIHQEKKLILYMSLTGGSLALAQPAGAAIAYSGVRNLGLDNATITQGIDLDGNGTAECNFVFNGGAELFRSVRITCPENSVLRAGNGELIQNLQRGALISGQLEQWAESGLLGRYRQQTFLSRYQRTYQCSLSGNYRGACTATGTATFYRQYQDGNFLGQQGFIGIRFSADNAIRYGWLQYRQSSIVSSGTIIDWAYETTAAGPIRAGDNGTAYAACIDSDQDGYGANCSVGPDCNDNDSAVHPQATELCNGRDENCNGLIDEGAASTFYRDADGDSYGAAAASVQACDQPAGYSADGTDCDDTDPAVHAGCCTVSIFPGSLSRFVRMIAPVAGFIITGNEQAELSRDTTIDWGTDAIETLFVVPITANSLFVAARLNGQALAPGAAYTITIGACTATVGVRAL